MTIEGLFPLLSLSTQYRSLLELLRPGQATGQAVLLGSALPYCVGALRNELNAPILVLVPRPERARQVYEDLLVVVRGGSGGLPATRGGDAALRATDGRRRHNPRAGTCPGSPAEAGRREPPDPSLNRCFPGGHIPENPRPGHLQASGHYVTVGQMVNLGDLMDRWQKMGYRWSEPWKVPGRQAGAAAYLTYTLQGHSSPPASN